MYELAYFFGTRNHPELIEYYINYVSEMFLEKNIGLYIYDGSDNEETKSIMEKYDFDFIHYHYCPNKSIGERIIMGINDSDANYICYGGDGQLPNLPYINRLFEILDKDYALINLSYRDKKGIVQKEYNDITDMFKDNCWDMTLGGSVFLKKDLYKNINFSEYIAKYHEGIFSYMIYYFDYFKDEEDFKGYYEALPIVLISPLKNGSAWSNNVLDIFGIAWSNAIYNLNSKYDKYKENAIKDHSIYSSLRLNEPIGFIRLKYNLSFSFRDFIKYRDTIKKISNINMIIPLLISLVPNCIVKLARKVYRGIKH